MTVDFKIKPSSDCSIILIDESSYNPENTTDYNDSFKYSDTYGFVILALAKSDGETYSEPIFDLHNGSNMSIPIKSDGHYLISYHVLPTKEYFENNKSLITLYYKYYSDGTTIYECDDSTDNSEKIIEDWTLIYTIDSTVSVESKDFVSICYLKKCYIDFCQQIFNDKAFSSCWANNNVDSELVYKRDLTWMALNVIKYLVEQEQLCEAERYIEILESCTGLCTSSTSTNKSSGCGCSK